MNRRQLIRRNGSPLVDRFPDDVDDPAQGLGPDGNPDRVAGVEDGLPANQTLGTVHGDGADGVLPQVLGDLEHETRRAVLDLEGVEDRREVGVELDVHDGTDNGDDAARRDAGGCGLGIVAFWKKK